MVVNNIEEQTICKVVYEESMKDCEPIRIERHVRETITVIKTREIDIYCENLSKVVRTIVVLVTKEIREHQMVPHINPEYDPSFSRRRMVCCWFIGCC